MDKEEQRLVLTLASVIVGGIIIITMAICFVEVVATRNRAAANRDRQVRVVQEIGDQTVRVINNIKGLEEPRK